MKTQPTQTSESNAPRVNTAAELDYVLAQRKQLAEVTAQRDELLAAGKKLSRLVFSGCDKETLHDALTEFRATIAKAEQH